ncbi:glycogen synthase [Patescibacteria group bacterium]
MVRSVKKKKYKVLMVAAEAAPYATVGGFSNVVAYLSGTLNNLGCEVRPFMPKYGSIDQDKFKLRSVCRGLKVPTSDENNPHLICNVKSHRSEHGVTSYFLENQEYYEKRANVYGYSDDPIRWALLSRGVIEFIKTGKFVPDIIHCNDWHTGIVSNYIKTELKKDPELANIATVFTIHNLSIQGHMLSSRNSSELAFDDGKSPVAPFFSPVLDSQNFMKRGILYSDVVNAVSKTYAKEILTPEFGEGLDRLLLELRGKLFGIINGLDYDEYNPKTDNLLAQNFDIGSIDLRAKNKAALQREFDLPVKKDTLLLGFVGRVEYQKGVDLIVETLHHVMKDYDVQFVQIGGGDEGLLNSLRDLKKRFPDKVGLHPFPNFTLPRLVFGGCDCILFPSRFEPCGIVQIEALRYGAVPIVRKVGGLADTVENFDSVTKKGNGFVFSDFDVFSLFASIIRAAELFRNKKLWKKLQTNAMKSDFSWGFSGKEYVKLYDLATLFRSKKNVDEKTIEDYLS